MSSHSYCDHHELTQLLWSTWAHTATVIIMSSHSYCDHHEHTQLLWSSWAHTATVIIMSSHRHCDHYELTQVLWSSWAHTATVIIMSTHTYCDHHMHTALIIIPRVIPGSVHNSHYQSRKVVSSIPGSVGYISHVHWAYDYLGPFGFLWVHMAWHKNCVEKKNTETFFP